MKYKLIKEYPGSPELGTVVERQLISKSYFFRSNNKNICILNSHVEDKPEYWKKVDNIIICVLEEIFEHKNGYCLPFRIMNAEVDCIEDIDKLFPYVKKSVFKTKEEAQYFILRNKPCLSYNDIAGYLGSGQRDVILNLIKKL